MFDVCLVGHVTKDINRFNDRTKNEMPAGAVYYAEISLQSLGLETAVITKAAKKDANEITAIPGIVGKRLTYRRTGLRANVSAATYS